MIIYQKISLNIWIFHKKFVPLRPQSFVRGIKRENWGVSQT